MPLDNCFGGSGGVDVNGVTTSCTVANGENITAGEFVEIINRESTIGEHSGLTRTVDCMNYSTTHRCVTALACKLDNTGRVLVVSAVYPKTGSGSTTYYVIARVLRILKDSITIGTATVLKTSSSMSIVPQRMFATATDKAVVLYAYRADAGSTTPYHACCSRLSVSGDSVTLTEKELLNTTYLHNLDAVHLKDLNCLLVWYTYGEISTNMRAMYALVNVDVDTPVITSGFTLWISPSDYYSDPSARFVCQYDGNTVYFAISSTLNGGNFKLYRMDIPSISSITCTLYTCLVSTTDTGNSIVNWGFLCRVSGGLLCMGCGHAYDVYPATGDPMYHLFAVPIALTNKIPATSLTETLVSNRKAFCVYHYPIKNISDYHCIGYWYRWQDDGMGYNIAHMKYDFDQYGIPTITATSTFTCEGTNTLSAQSALVEYGYDSLLLPFLYPYNDETNCKLAFIDEITAVPVTYVEAKASSSTISGVSTEDGVAGDTIEVIVPVTT